MIPHIVIPARNEAEHIGRLVRAISLTPFGGSRIIVVDNGSTDRTCCEALEAGAHLIVREERVGKGFAVAAGLAAADSETVLVLDADIEGITPAMLRQLELLYDPVHAPVVRLAIGRSAMAAPVTTLVARPLLNLLTCPTTSIAEPIGGLLLVNRKFVLLQHIPGGWGFDIALTMQVLNSGLPLPEVPVEGVTHRQRSLESYVEMSHEVIRAALIIQEKIPWGHEDCIRCQREQV